MGNLCEKYDIVRGDGIFTKGAPHLAPESYVLQKQLHASQIIWYNKHILLDKRSFYDTTLPDQGTNHEEQLYDTNVAIKAWSVFKSDFS